MILDGTGLKPLDTSGLTAMPDDDLGVSGLTPLDVTGLTPLPEPKPSIFGSFRRGFNRAQQAASVAGVETGALTPQEFAAAFARDQVDIKQTPPSEAVRQGFQDIEEAEGWLATGAEILKNPQVVASVTGESLGMLPAQLISGIVGAATGAGAGALIGSPGGPPGAAAGAVTGLTVGGAAGLGTGSAALEYAGAITEAMAEAGVDLTNPTEIVNAFSDPAIMDKARRSGIARGVPIGMIDALSFGVAGRVSGPVRKLTGGNKVVGEGAELLVQALSGSAGEAAAQYVDRGEITGKADVLLEGIAEIATGVPEIVAGRAIGKLNAKGLKPVVPEVPQVPEGAQPAEPVIGTELTPDERIDQAFQALQPQLTPDDRVEQAFKALEPQLTPDERVAQAFDALDRVDQPKASPEPAIAAPTGNTLGEPYLAHQQGVGGGTIGRGAPVDVSARPTEVSGTATAALQPEPPAVAPETVAATVTDNKFDVSGLTPVEDTPAAPSVRPYRGIPVSMADERSGQIRLDNRPPINVTIGPVEQGSIFVVDQVDPQGNFTGHQAMLGFNTEQEALDAFEQSAPAGTPSRAGAVTPMTLDQFQSFLEQGVRRALAYRRPRGRGVSVDRPFDHMEVLASQGGIRDEITDIDREANGRLVEGEMEQILSLVAEGNSVEDSIIMVFERNDAAFDAPAVTQDQVDDVPFDAGPEEHAGERDAGAIPPADEGRSGEGEGDAAERAEPPRGEQDPVQEEPDKDRPVDDGPAGEDPSSRSQQSRVLAMSRDQVGEPLAIYRNVDQLKAHTDYSAAKGGDVMAALRLVADVVPREMVTQAAERFGPDAIYAPVVAEERTGRNRLPQVLAEVFADETGAQAGSGIAQANRPYHTGANAIERLMSRALFAGPVTPGGRYVIVDDVTVMGSTIAEMANHILDGGGEVVGVVLLVNGSRMSAFLPTGALVNDVKRRFGDEISNQLQIEPDALTAAEVQYLRNFRDADALRTRIAAARRKRDERADKASVGAQEGGDRSAVATTEPGADGRDQAVSPGATAISERQQVARDPEGEKQSSASQSKPTGIDRDASRYALSDRKTATVPIVDVSRRFGGDNFSQQRRQARRWSKENIRGAYRNEDTGWSISLDSGGIGKATSGRRSQADLDVLQALPELLKSSVLVETQEPRTNQKGLIAVHILYGVARIDRTPYRVRLVVREQRNGMRFYDQHSLEISDLGVQGVAWPTGSADGPLGPTEVTIDLSKLRGDVKQHGSGQRFYDQYSLEKGGPGVRGVALQENLSSGPLGPTEATINIGELQSDVKTGDDGGNRLSDAQDRQTTKQSAEALIHEMRRILFRMGLNSVGLRIANKIRAHVNGKLADADGRYYQSFIDISLNAADPLAVLHHEALHALIDNGFFTRSELAALRDRSRSDWMKRYDIETRYRGFSEQTQIEEGIAAAFEAFMAGRDQPKGVIGRAMAKLRTFIEGLRNALRGRGFVTAEGLFRQVGEGKKRPTVPQPDSDGLFGDESLQDGLFSIRDSADVPRSAAMSKEIVGEPLSVFRNTQAMKRHGSYNAAKAGDLDAALKLVADLVEPERFQEALDRFGAGAIYTPIHAEEPAGRNTIPLAMSETFAARANGVPGRDIVQINRAYHTGANAAERLIARPLFAGPVVEGARYVIVDDVTVMGSTIAEMAHHIVEGGGEVVGVVVLVNASRMGEFLPGPRIVNDVRRRFGDEITKELRVEPEALTASEAHYLRGFRDADALRDRIAKATSERVRRLHAKGVGEGQGDSQGRTEVTGSEPGAKRSPDDPVDEPRSKSFWALSDRKTVTVPIVDVSTRFDGDNFYEQRRQARRWSKENIRGAYRNEDTGWSIEIDGGGISKATSGRRSQSDLDLLPVLPELLQSSVLVETRDPRPGEQGLEAVHIFYGVARIDGTPYRVRMVIRQQNNGKRFYDQHSLEIGGPGVQGVALQENLSSGPLGPTEATINIGELQSDVKTGDDGRTRLSDAQDRQTTKQSAEALIHEMRRILFRMGLNSAGLRIANKIRAHVNGKLADADGRYYQGLIDISLNAADPLAVLHHEALHALIDNGFFTRSELAALRDRSRSDWMKRYDIETRYRGFPEETQVEEGIAAAFEAFMAGGDRPKGIIGRAMTKLRTFIEGLRNALRGRGFVTAEGLFRQASEGKKRPSGKTPEAREQDPRFALKREPETAEQRQQVMQGFFARGQFLDRAIRLPFNWFGGLDREGRWKPGVKLAEASEKVITEAEFNDGGAFAPLNGILRTARNGLIDRYGLDPDYVARYRRRALDKKAVVSEAKEILETLNASVTNADEAAVLQAVLTGEKVDDARMQRLAEPIRNAIDELGQEAVILGLISRESFERNRGSYLHRVHLKHEADLQENALVRFTSRIFDRQRKRIVSDRLKGRGIFLDVPVGRLMRDHPDFGKAGRGRPQNGDKVRVLDELGIQNDPPDDPSNRVLRRVYWPADKPVPDRYETFRDKGVWEIRADTGQKLTLWRDYTKDERSKMGEILDARYTIAKTYMLMANDLSTGRFFKDIAENEDWTSATPPKAKWVNAAEANRFAPDSSVQWVKVPDADLPGTTGKKRYGAIAGKYVRAEIWRDLNELDIMNRPGTWRTLLTQWKLNKTGRSPVVHMNNVMSNLVFMDLADIRGQDLARGIRSYITSDTDYQEAAAHGAFGADMMAQEIRENALRPILEDIQRGMQGGAANSFMARARLVGKLADRLWTYAKRADQAMINAYQAEDEIFRMATYKRRRQFGDTPEQAADFARQQFLDYDIRAPWVNAARNSVLPFISYTYRAAPLIAKAIAYRPWKLAKYFAVAYAVNALGYGWDDEGDEERERASLRRDEQGYTWVGVPRMIRMPYRDQNGLPVFLDVRRWIPAGDIFDLGQGQSAIPIPAPLQFGGPLMLGAEFFLDKAAFTGEPITNKKTDTLWDSVEATADWAWKSWMPSAAWIPGSWYWTKIRNALVGATDSQGRPYSLREAAASSFGVNLKPQDVEQGLYRQFNELREVERELRKQAQRLGRNRERGLISETSYNQEIQSIMDKLERLGEQTVDLQKRATPRSEARP